MPRPAVKTSPAAPKTVRDVRRIMRKLSAQYPNADTELHFTTPYELLVATILSAQCTDERVNQVTPALFRRYPDARALADATTGELEPQIQSTGFFRAKSRSLVGMAAAVVAKHDGEVPRTMEELVALPGVGRKTANVVLGHALGVPGLPVDRHVLRVANRLGIARSDDPEVVEQQLGAALPPAEWTRASDTLILHGRRICKPRPVCDRCAVREECHYYRRMLGAVPERQSLSATPRTQVGQLSQARRAAKLRGTGVGGGATRQEKENGAGRRHHAERRSRETQVTRVGPRDRQKEAGQVLPSRRAAEPRGTGRGGGAPAERPTHGQVLPPPRAAKLRGTGVGGGAPAERPTHGQVLPSRRAAEPRGTGRGGGAPRQIKK